MMLDYSKLDQKIDEVFGCRVNFAIKMGLSERTISLKMNSKVDFKQGEILKACSLLGIPLTQIPRYFFTPKTQ